MKYIVKNEENKLMIMASPGAAPSIPGIEVLGLESELNPEGKDLVRLSWEQIELEPAVEAVEGQEAEYDEDDNEISPAVEAVEAKAAVMGMALVDDSDKILVARQAKANANLESIRQLRDPLLTDADRAINIAEDPEDAPKALELRAYRVALRECTDSLKKVNGDAKLSCENLVASEFEFPVKP